MNTIRNVFFAMVCYVAFSGSVVAQQVTELNDQTKQEVIGRAQEYAEKAKFLPQDIYQKLNAANTSGSMCSEEQLEKLLKSVMDLVVPKTPENEELRAGIAQVQGLIAKKLQDYKVSGYSFAIDPNGAFFVDNQDPQFTVVYKDAKGDIKTRRYQASIDSMGLKVEFAVSFDLIFFTNTSVNFYDSEKVIELGRGIEMNLFPLTFINTAIFKEPFTPWTGRDFYNPDIHWTGKAINQILWMTSLAYVPFKNMPGGLILLGFNFGISGNLLNYITGGTLTPLAQ